METLRISENGHSVLRDHDVGCTVEKLLVLPVADASLSLGFAEDDLNKVTLSGILSPVKGLHSVSYIVLSATY